MSYKTDAAEYMWFVLVTKHGEPERIWSGFEYRSDAVDEANQVRDYMKVTRFVSRALVPKDLLAEFYKSIGVSERMQAAGLKRVRHRRMAA